MLRQFFLGLAVLAVIAFAGATSAEAGCRGGGYYGGGHTGGGFYGGGFYGGGYRAPVSRRVHYYGAPAIYYGPSAYHRSYYGGGYGGGYPAYYGGRRSGVSVSFGF